MQPLLDGRFSKPLLGILSFVFILFSLAVADAQERPAVADLAIKLTASPDPVAVGKTLTYTLTVTNNGPATANYVTVTDSLPYDVTLKSISMAGGECKVIAGVPFCDLERLAAGQAAVVKITVSVNEYPSGGTLANKAVVAAADNERDPKNNNRAYLISGVSADESKAPPPPPPSAGDDCAGQPAACKRELGPLRDDINRLQRKATYEADSRNAWRKAQREDESKLKPAATLERQYRSCVTDLKQDAAKTQAKIYTDGSGRLVGIGPAGGPKNELSEARQKTLTRAMDLCNRLYDKWQKAQAQAESRESISTKLPDGTTLTATSPFGRARSVEIAKELAADAEARLAKVEQELARKKKELTQATRRCQALAKQCAESPASAAPTKAPKPPVATGFAGDWQTSEGLMRLKASGQGKVSGTYTTDQGRVFLDVQGRQARGIWVERDSDRRCAEPRDGSRHWGWIAIKLDETGQRFSGNWGYCEEKNVAGPWTGTRTVPQ